MTPYTLANNVRALLQTSIDGSATSITITSPSAPFNAPPTPTSANQPGVLTLADGMSAPTKVEVITYTGVVDNGNGTHTITGVTRAREGTSAQSHTAGGVTWVYQAPTKGVLNFGLAISAVDALTPAADKLAYYTSGSAAALADITAFGRSLIDDGDAATARATLGLGTAALSSSGDFQPIDATLTALAAANWAANAIPIGSGADALSQVSFAANTFPARSSSGNLVAKTITDFGLSLVDDTDAAAGRATLGATTVGGNLFTLSNPGAITFPRLNADNTVTARSAADFKTDLSLNAVENTALSTWAGTTNITTVGTIASGTWNGAVVGSSYGGTGNAFFAVSGPASSTKTYTFPNSSATILYEGGTIGGVTPAAITGTTITATGALTVGASSTIAQDSSSGLVSLRVRNDSATVDATTASGIIFADVGADRWSLAQYRDGTGGLRVYNYSAATSIATFSTAGLAITGLISATDTIALTRATGVPKISITATTGTNEAYVNLVNTGGVYYYGVENSAGSWFGATPYAMALLAPSGKTIEALIAGSKITAVSSTGLAITGTLSSTSDALIRGAAGSAFAGTTGVAIGGTTPGLSFEGSATPWLIYKSGDTLRVWRNTSSTDIASFSSTGLDITGSVLASGAIRSAGAVPQFYTTDQSTNGSRAQFVNTGGTLYVGLDSSVGGLGGAYTANIWHSGDYKVVIGSNNASVAYFDKTKLQLQQNTASTSTTTGSLVVTGGAGVSGTINANHLKSLIGYGFGAEANQNSGNTSTTITYDWSTTVHRQKLTLNATSGGITTTVAFTNPSESCSIILKVVTSSTQGANQAITWDSDIKWAGGVIPDHKTGNSKTHIYSFYFDGTNYFGSAMLDCA